MEYLPDIFDEDEAIEVIQDSTTTDAAKAYAYGLLSNWGHSNHAIRDMTGVDKVYVVTHYKRAGTKLSDDELVLWHNNPRRITLGHIRACLKMDEREREELLRDLLIKKKSVSEVSDIANKRTAFSDADLKRYINEVTEKIGRNMKFNYKPMKGSGTITLDFYDLADLDYLVGMLGYTKEAEY